VLLVDMLKYYVNWTKQKVCNEFYVFKYNKLPSAFSNNNNVSVL